VKKVLFIFFIIFTFSHLQSSPASSFSFSQNSFWNDIDWVDSLNMNLIGMWNFGYPCAISTKDSFLYLGSGGCVIIFDLIDTTNPEKIGDISFPGMYVRGIYVLDTLMFVADGEKGLRIANISDPVNPIEVGANDSTWAHSVFARNQLAYVLELKKDSVTIGELVIYDVSNPQEPNILGKETLPKAHIKDVIVKDTFAYIANGQGGLRIINVSDSTNPFETSYFIPPGYAYSLAICCDTLLLLSTEPVSCKGGLWVINIKNPYNPYPMGCDTSFVEGMDVSYFSHYAYVSSVTEGVKIIDFVDPSNPYIVGEFLPPYDPWNIVNANIGPFIYAGEWWGNALRTIDAQDPTQPVTINYDLIPDQSQDVSVQGDYAYVANFFSGVYILDVSDPSNPKDISHYDTPGRCNSIVVKDTIAYVSDENSIILLNIQDPFNPQKISELPLACDGYGLELNFPYLYVTSEWNHQFIIVDVNNPLNPFITGTCDLNGTSPTYICYKDSFAFVSAPIQGVAVINTKDVYNPTLLTYCPLSGYPRGIGYSGNYLYVSDFDTTLVNIVDISDPTSPVLVNSFSTIMYYPFALSISDTLLYVALQIVGIEVFNISSPLSPISVGHYSGHPLCTPLGITVANGLSYLTADNGIYIFEYTGSTGKKEEVVVKNKSKTKISFKCYPSTFSKKVSIEVNTKKEENLKLTVYDVAGRKIKDIFDGKIKGMRLFSWNGLNNSNIKVATGVYFTRLKSSNFTSVKKVILVK